MITTNLTTARGYIDHADRLITETYPLTRDPKLLIPTLRLIKQSLESIGDTQILATIAETLAAYDECVVEFTRDDLLVFADDKMRATTLSLSQVLLALDETKRAYAEAYR